MCQHTSFELVRGPDLLASGRDRSRNQTASTTGYGGFLPHQREVVHSMHENSSPTPRTMMSQYADSITSDDRLLRHRREVDLIDESSGGMSRRNSALSCDSIHHERSISPSPQRHHVPHDFSVGQQETMRLLSFLHEDDNLTDRLLRPREPMSSSAQNTRHRLRQLEEFHMQGSQAANQHQPERAATLEEELEARLDALTDPMIHSDGRRHQEDFAKGIRGYAPNNIPTFHGVRDV